MDRFDGRRDVLAGATAGLADDPVLAVLGEVQRGLVGIDVLPIVGRDELRVALLPAGVALRELLVEVAGVEQHDRGQLHGARRGVDRARVALASQDRQQPAVVEVGVRQEDGVQLGWFEVERDPVPDRLVGTALEHAAVDEHASPRRDEEELRPGHGGRAAEEVDLHQRMVTGAARRRVSSRDGATWHRGDGSRVRGPGRLVRRPLSAAPLLADLARSG